MVRSLVKFPTPRVAVVVVVAVASMLLFTTLGVTAATNDSLVIDAALDAVAYTSSPTWATGCTSSNAVQIASTANQGSFLLCALHDQAWITFASDDANGRRVVLATFENIEHNSYNTRTWSTGNWCHNIGLKSGSHCYRGVAQDVAQSFFPGWNGLVVTDASMAQFIQDRFAPLRVATNGVQSRCFSNTGEFIVTGLPTDAALMALTQRNFGYSGCDNSEGDNRFWTSVLWFYPQFFGSMIIFIGVVLASIIAGIGGCCCAGFCAH